MRVTVLAPEIAHTGGQERVTLYLVRHLLQQGHTIQAVTRAVDPSLLEFPGFKAHLVHCRKRPVLAGYLSFLLLAGQAARGLPRADAVINTENTTLIPADLTYSHYCHSAYRHRRVVSRASTRRAYNLVFDLLNSATERLVYRRLSKLVVAVSNQHRNELVHDAHVPADRVKVVLNGVDTTEFFPAASEAERGQLRRDLRLSAEQSLLLFAGDLRSPRKGLDTVFRALARLPDDVLLVVAGDTHGSGYPAIARAAGLEHRVKFMGFRRDLSAIMRACDLFVLPTHYDPCSLVVPEAMGAGLPPFTTSGTGAAEIITDQVDGVVLPNAEDDTFLANSIDRVLREPGHRQAMSRAARQTALAYDWSRVAAKVEQLLLSVARPRSTA